MKKKLLTVLLVAAMFIPGIIAVINYTYLKNTPLEYRSLSRLDITDVSGNVFELHDGADEATERALDFFVTMNKKAKQVDALPSELEDTECFTFTYYSYANKSDYKYYFTLASTDAYYVNDKGTAYKLAAEDANSFLCMSYARSLYEGSELPVLSVSDADPVVPSTVKWTFRNVNSEFVDYATSYETTKSLTSYEMASDFSMKFSVEPDSFFITVTQDEAELYKGEYASLALPTSLDLEKPVTVEVSAEWYESVEHIYAGSTTYRFDATLVPPPTFNLTASDGEYVEQGSMVVLTGKNVKNPEEITVTSSPDIGYTPRWYQNNETGSVYALVPIPIDIDYGDAGEFVFTVECAGTTSTLSVPYEEYRYQTLSGLSEASFESEFNTVTQQITDPADGTVYFDGAFANPVSDTGGLKGFGRTVDSSYRHNGVDFTNVGGGDTVYAGAAGTVAYVGTFTSGQSVVVIEHGLGLRSWYVNMGTIGADITVGAPVEAGTAIGTCAGSSLHCSITVFGEPVSPYKFWAFTADYPEFLKVK